MDGLTFVHCADLHLDSPFEGIRAHDPGIAEILKESTFRAFDNVIDLAIRERADFLVVAGDVYDGEDRSLRAQMYFRDGLVRAAEHGIWSFVAHGNHDPLSGWEAGLRMPERVVRFADRVERFPYRRGGEEVAVVYGVSYPRREVTTNLARQFSGVGGGPFTIGILHCNVGGMPGHDNYAPCVMDDLAATGLDYWALGHIHTRQILHRGKPWVVYPGNTQARSVRETGERGCYLVRVSAYGQVNCEFVPTDVVRWFVERLDIGGLAGPDDLLDALRALCHRVRERAGGRCAVVRVLLGGRGPLHRQLGRQGVLEDILARVREEERGRPDLVWIESLGDVTRPAVDLDQRSTIGDFVGEFLRCVRECRRGPDHAFIREVLASRSEAALIRSYLDELSDEDLLSILERAEALGFDLLAGEEE